MNEAATVHYQSLQPNTNPISTNNPMEPTMKIALFVGLLVPCIAQAEDISCKGPSGWEKVEAQTLEQARFTSQQRWHRQVPCIKGDPNNSFDSGDFVSQQDLRPFLPPDIKLPPRAAHMRKGDADTSSFRCDYSGNFTPDGSRDQSRCRTLESASMGLWKIRRADGYPDNVVLWRLPEHKLDGKAQFWLHKTKEGVQLMSPQAAEYARGRGFAITGKIATSIGPSGESVGGSQQQAATANATPDRASPRGSQAAPPATAADCNASANLLQKAKCLAKATGVVK